MHDDASQEIAEDTILFTSRFLKDNGKMIVDSKGMERGSGSRAATGVTGELFMHVMTFEQRGAKLTLKIREQRITCQIHRAISI